MKAGTAELRQSSTAQYALVLAEEGGWPLLEAHITGCFFTSEINDMVDW